jgi:putative acetyltransferase
MVTIRAYQQSDADAVYQLFYDTVHTINCRDYSQAQLQAWAPEIADKRQWQQRLLRDQPLLAYANEQILGYADLQPDGLIDQFFCHHDHQQQGVGSALMQALIIKAQQLQLQRMYAHVSITAKPFFERWHFQTICMQQVTIRDQQFTNYLMEKSLVHLH